MTRPLASAERLAQSALTNEEIATGLRDVCAEFARRGHPDGVPQRSPADAEPAGEGGKVDERALSRSARRESMSDFETGRLKAICSQKTRRVELVRIIAETMQARTPEPLDFGVKSNLRNLIEGIAAGIDALAQAHDAALHPDFWK